MNKQPTAKQVKSMERFCPSPARQIIDCFQVYLKGCSIDNECDPFGTLDIPRIPKR